MVDEEGLHSDDPTLPLSGADDAHLPEAGDEGEEDPAPAAVGPYRVLKRLGRGGMGDVFLAFDGVLERKVALKRIRPDRLDKEVDIVV